MGRCATDCGRWNLSPLEERWEAIEECERLFRGTLVRVSTDNIGLARLADGLELIRIGKPLRPEFAAWRYGRHFGTRRRRSRSDRRRRCCRGRSRRRRARSDARAGPRTRRHLHRRRSRPHDGDGRVSHGRDARRARLHPARSRRRAPRAGQAQSSRFARSTSATSSSTSTARATATPHLSSTTTPAGPSSRKRRRFTRPACSSPAPIDTAPTARAFRTPCARSSTPGDAADFLSAASRAIRGAADASCRS